MAESHQIKYYPMQDISEILSFLPSIDNLPEILWMDAHWYIRCTCGWMHIQEEEIDHPIIAAQKHKFPSGLNTTPPMDSTDFIQLKMLLRFMDWGMGYFPYKNQEKGKIIDLPEPDQYYADYNDRDSNSSSDGSDPKDR